MVSNRFHSYLSHNPGPARESSKPQPVQQSQQPRLDRDVVKKIAKNLMTGENFNLSVPKFCLVNKGCFHISYNSIRDNPDLFISQVEKQLSEGKELSPAIFYFLKQDSKVIEKIFHYLLSADKYFPRASWCMIYVVCDLKDESLEKNLEKVLRKFGGELVPSEVPWFQIKTSPKETKIKFKSFILDALTMPRSEKSLSSFRSVWSLREVSDLYNKLVQEISKPCLSMTEGFEDLRCNLSVSLSKNERQEIAGMLVNLEEQLLYGEKPSSGMLTTLDSFPQDDVLWELSLRRLKFPRAILYLLDHYKRLDSSDDASITLIVETAFLNFKKKFLAMPWLKDEKERGDLIKKVWDKISPEKSLSFGERQETTEPSVTPYKSAILIFFIKTLLEHDMQALRSLFMRSGEDRFDILTHLDSVIMHWADYCNPSSWPVTPNLELCPDNHWNLLKNYFIDSVREKMKADAEDESRGDVGDPLMESLPSYIIKENKIPPLTDAQREYIEGAFPQLNPKPYKALT